MAKSDLVLGIDSSTQSTSAVIMGREDLVPLAEACVRYRDDPRLRSFGLTEEIPVLPSREPGEADQPAAIFLAALDALFEDLPRELLGRLGAVNLSAQQHGQIWLSERGAEAIHDLRRAGFGSRGRLAERIAPGLADGRAPIWMSADTALEAAELRRAAGGAAAMTELSGSDSPLRFTGAVTLRRARRFPRLYGRTTHIHLISSFLAAVLCGDPDTPIDWGGASGTSLMDWSGRKWAPRLLSAVSAGLEGGVAGLESRLPRLVHPLTIVGGIAAYFSERYGMPGDCAVVAGSGDNPQSKVLAEGSLLSLGTSFVLMTEGRTPHLCANAMYDGLGRPFLFGCRTNGALVLEALRRAHGLARDDFATSDAALEAFPPGSVLRLFQPERESFPASGPLDIGIRADFPGDYAGAVDAALGLMVLASEPFGSVGAGLTVTGGVASSRVMLRRIATLWGTRALPVAEAGAAAGAAIAAACALVAERERGEIARRGRMGATKPGIAIEPDADLVEACRKPGGYLERLEALFIEATGTRPAEASASI